jgi:hypothetical protein
LSNIGHDALTKLNDNHGTSENSSLYFAVRNVIRPPQQVQQFETNQTAAIRYLFADVLGGDNNLRYNVDIRYTTNNGVQTASPIYMGQPSKDSTTVSEYLAILPDPLSDPHLQPYDVYATEVMLTLWRA